MVGFFMVEGGGSWAGLERDGIEMGRFGAGQELRWQHPSHIFIKHSCNICFEAIAFCSVFFVTLPLKVGPQTSGFSFFGR